MDSYQRLRSLKWHSRKLSTGSTPAKSTIPSTTAVQKVNIAEYFYLRELIKDENIIIELNNCLTGMGSGASRLSPHMLPPSDPLLELLVHAKSINEVFELINDHFLNEKYTSQAIITLWNLQKIYIDMRPDLDVIGASENLNKFIQVFL